MKTEIINKKVIIFASALAVVGLLVGGVSIAWIAGSLSISAAAANQIVEAIKIGGWAITVIGAVFGLGITGAAIATVRWLIVRRGTAVAVA